MQVDNQRVSEEERLLLGVLEQIKQPFVQISRLAELAQMSSSAENWASVLATSASALGLVESYALSLRLRGKLVPLELEAVSISSLLYDTAQDLAGYAKQYHVELELENGAKLLPIIGDRNILRSALLSLGYVFIEAGARGEHKLQVRLSAHRSRYGTVAGLYTSLQDFGADNLRRALELKGRARQPLQKLSANPAAGVFVADALLNHLSTHLHVARYHKLTGLATTLLPSQQLQLV